jgi:DNA repair protein RadD
MYELREYQQAAVDAAITWHKYKDTPAIIDISGGGGKSVVMAKLAEHYYHQGLRVAMLAHRKKLLEQNGGKLSIPHGYCSASLGDANLEERVIVGGIQTIANRVLAPFDVIIVDECQRLSNNNELGQYWQFINQHKPRYLMGATATPYRLAGGLLDWGNIVYSIKYPELLKMDYLCPITNKVKADIDLSQIKITAGDYNEAQLADYMENPALIDAAVRNIKAYSKDRNCVIIFAASKRHCVLLSNVMEANGMVAGVITDDTPEKERDRLLAEFHDGYIKYIINRDILLEGYDEPRIDMIVSLRPTKSKGLWEQSLYRGVRKHDSKKDCLLIDMAGNLVEHGGLGYPYKEPSKKEKPQNKGKICPACESFIPLKDKECPDCGFVFEVVEPSKIKHDYSANTSAKAVAFDAVERLEVYDVWFKEHKSKAGNRSIRVTYVTPAAKYGETHEYINCWHDNDWVRNKAWLWFAQRGFKFEGDIKERDADTLIGIASELKRPSAIHIDFSDKFPKIVQYEWDAQASGGDDPAASHPLDGDTIVF